MWITIHFPFKLVCFPNKKRHFQSPSPTHPKKVEDPPPTLPGIDDPPQTDRPVPGTGLAVTRLLGSHLFLDPYNVRPPFDSVQLVNITPITMVYGIYNELVPGANLNQHSHHIVGAGYIFYNVNLAPSQALSKCSTIWGSESANTRTSLRDSCGCRQLRGKRTKQRSAEETATHRCWEK